VRRWLDLRKIFKSLNGMMSLSLRINWLLQAIDYSTLGHY